MAFDLDFHRGELIRRRNRLTQALSAQKTDRHLHELLDAVDSALADLDQGRYGLCEVCQEPIEHDRLFADPLARVCLDHLTSTERRLLEADLELAGRIQKSLLPQGVLPTEPWEVAFHYEGAGPVSGDYCDLLSSDRDRLLFAVGDVSGKGIAASMLAANLQATLRALVAAGLAVGKVLEHANRMFCEATPTSHFASLVLAAGDSEGRLELGNAGHPSPLVVRGGVVEPITATGLPLGMFCSGEYDVRRLSLAPGETVFLYTDGLIEARNPADEEYGESRAAAMLAAHAGEPPAGLVTAFREDLASFLGRAARTDDLTLMAIRRR